VDACPNLNAVAEVPSYPIAEPEESAKPVDDREKEISGSTESAAFRKVFSRSLSLDRSRIGSREIREQAEGRDLRAVDRLSRRIRISDDETSRRLRESRFRDVRNSFDATRSRGSSNRAVDHRYADYRSQNSQRRLADRTSYRLEDRRSRSTERRELNDARRQDRVGRSMDSRNFQRHVSVDRDRRSLSTDRRALSEIDRQESIRKISREHRDLARDRADRRSEMRGGRSLRSIERDAERSSRREDRRNLLAHSARIARGDIDRNNNLDLRNRERSVVEVRRTLVDRVTNRVRGPSIRDSRDLIRSNDHRSLSRSLERLSANDPPREILSRRVRSVESDIEKVNDRRLSERRSLVRSMERREINLERRKDENHRFHDRRSLDRTSRILSADYDRSISNSRGVVNQRDSRENRVRKNSRTALTRSRYDHEEMANQERRERLVRSSRSIDINQLDRQFVRIRDLRDQERKLRDSSMTRRDSNLERQKWTDSKVSRRAENCSSKISRRAENCSSKVSRRAENCSSKISRRAENCPSKISRRAENCP